MSTCCCEGRKPHEHIRNEREILDASLRAAAINQREQPDAWIVPEEGISQAIVTTTLDAHGFDIGERIEFVEYDIDGDMIWRNSAGETWWLNEDGRSFRPVERDGEL